MATRLRLYDCRHSRLPTLVGLCAGDIPNIANYVNSAQRRLIYANEAGEEGWNGTFAEIAFTVNRTNPYWTGTRDIARLQGVNVCQVPFEINNQFLEYLRFGNGRLPKTFLTCPPTIQQVFTRNNVPTFVDLSNPPQIIEVHAGDAADIEAGKRVLIQGTDNNGTTIYTQDGLNQVQGEFVVLESPFVSPSAQFNSITGIQKDVTHGQVRIYQTDPATGEQVLLLTMEPGEETASYRRYYFSNLPSTCCQTSPGTASQNVTVTAIAKLEMIPVVVDTDYCLIQNLEAIIEEAQSVRYSEIDTPAAKQMAQERHLQAIRLLRGEMTHYQGIDDVAVDWAPFGSARLSRLKIGSML